MMQEGERRIGDDADFRKWKSSQPCGVSGGALSGPPLHGPSRTRAKLEPREALQCNGLQVIVNQSDKAGQPLKDNFCLSTPWSRLREHGLPFDQVLHVLAWSVLRFACATGMNQQCKPHPWSHDPLL